MFLLTYLISIVTSYSLTGADPQIAIHDPDRSGKF